MIPMVSVSISMVVENLGRAQLAPEFTFTAADGSLTETASRWPTVGCYLSQLRGGRARICVAHCPPMGALLLTSAPCLEQVDGPLLPLGALGSKIPFNDLKVRSDQSSTTRKSINLSGRIALMYTSTQAGKSSTYATG
eukprot:m.457268 g.457268  ORF g.457268 m.457268 type:complete len:138 (+) comp21222_c0_seq1:1975-2388(+)